MMHLQELIPNQIVTGLILEVCALEWAVYIKSEWSLLHK